MIAFTTVSGLAVALESDLIESVCQDPETLTRCVIRMASGKEYCIGRSYAYVTRVLRAKREHPEAL
jgi:uncharacterized protein YlzI (FlbEa/FlbD family)